MAKFTLTTKKETTNRPVNSCVLLKNGEINVTNKKIVNASIHYLHYN